MRRRWKGHSDGSGTPRIVRAAPSTCKGTRRSFLTAPQKGSSGPTLARGASSDPAGLTARPGQRPGPEARGKPHIDARQAVLDSELTDSTPCHPRARTERKPGTLSCGSTTTKPPLTRKAAGDRCPQNELPSNQSSVPGKGVTATLVTLLCQIGQQVDSGPPTDSSRRWRRSSRV